VAVSLGYKNVYRYPEGYPEWQQSAFPITTIDFLDSQYTKKSSNPVPVPVGLHLVLVLTAVLLGGFALNLTPCVYPLIPITVSYFGGRSERIEGNKVLHGICYILGLSLTNSTLGVVAAFTGGLVGSLLQSTFILSSIATILLIFSLSLFGLWEIRLPSTLNAFASRTYRGLGGSLFMGLTLGVISAPCVGPFVIGLLSWIAAIGKIWFGFTVFFILSIGMGLPLFILAIFSGNIDRLPRSGEWLIWVKKLMGWILVGMAAYFTRPLFSEFQSIVIYSVIGISASLHLGWLERSAAHSPGFGKFRKIFGICCLGFVIFFTGKYIVRSPGVSWVPYSDTILEKAIKEEKPVIIDFYAAWCTPCRKMEITTFHSPEVVEQSQHFIMIKVDLTTSATVEQEALIDHFEIKGVPTILFFDANGTERRNLRLVDFLSPNDFLKRMKKLMLPMSM